MATFNVTDPVSGRSVKLTGDSPPTEQELEQIFSTLDSKKTAPIQEPVQRAQAVAAEPLQQPLITQPVQQAASLATERFGSGAVRPAEPAPQVQPQRSPIQAGQFQEVELAQPEGAFGSFLTGLRQGALNIGTGILTGVGELRSALGDEEAEKFLSNLEVLRNVERSQTERATVEQPIARVAGEIVGEIAALPLPGGVGATLPARVATAAGTGALAGGIGAAGRGEDIADNALIGAGFGLGFQGLTEGGRTLARRLINAKAGQFTSDDIAELVDTSKREGIDLFADDAAAQPLLKKLGILAEDVPVVGTRGGRLGQVSQQREAAERLLENLSGDLQDFSIEAQKGLQRRLKTVKAGARNLFNKAAQKLDPAGELPRTNFVGQIDTEIEQELAKGTRANQNIINVLESFKDSPSGNFSRVRQQRSDLGDEISEFFKGDNKSIGAKGVDSLQRVKNALENDIESFVEQSGSQEGLRLFKQANAFTVRKLIPFKETQLKSLVKTPEPEKIVSFLRGSGGRQSRANILFNALDVKGRQAVKAALVNDAFEKASTGREVFSANTFASEMEKVQNATDTFFRGQDKKELNGLVRLMRATGRAGQVAEQPPTGARLLIPGVAATAVADLGTTIVGVGGFGAVSRLLFQTKKGRDLLTGLNKTTPGSKNFENILQQMNTLLTRSAITQQQEQK